MRSRQMVETGSVPAADSKALSFRSYEPWIRQSNEAGVFRIAFDAADQMSIEVRGAVVEAVYRQSIIE